MDDFDRYLETSLARLLEASVDGPTPPRRRPRGKRLVLRSRFIPAAMPVPVTVTVVVPPTG